MLQQILTHRPSSPDFLPNFKSWSKILEFPFLQPYTLLARSASTPLSLHFLSALTFHIGHYHLIPQLINSMERILGSLFKSLAPWVFPPGPVPSCFHCGSLPILFHSCHQKLEIQQYKLSLDFYLTVYFSSLPFISMRGNIIALITSVRNQISV